MGAPLEFYLLAFVVSYALTLIFDLLKTLIETAIVVFGRRSRKTVTLLPSECCFVIPCHNSETSIRNTLETLPPDYSVICVPNACADKTAETIAGFADETKRDVQMVELTTPGKINAVLHGILSARQRGFSHFVLLDDDVRWPISDIRVLSKDVPATALPVIPIHPRSWIEVAQFIEYAYMIVSKMAQGLLGNTIMASGAAGVYRIDTFLEVLKQHDGEFIGDDLQSAFIHHRLSYRIDFLPDILVQTVVPSTFEWWWRQRAKRWEVSPIYLLPLSILTVVGAGTTGWWIRCIAFYRIFVVGNDLVRLVFLPFVLFDRPETVLGVWIITYVCMVAKGLVYWRTFPIYRSQLDRFLLFGLITFPAYGALTWVSRVWAVPKGAMKLLTRKPQCVYTEYVVAEPTT